MALIWNMGLGREEKQEGREINKTYKEKKRKPKKTRMYKVHNQEEKTESKIEGIGENGKSK
jgi:hypothetical protein